MKPAVLDRLGATPLGENRCRFEVWAPERERVEVKLVGRGERLEPLERGEDGHWSAVLDDVAPGARYFYRLDGRLDRPDPASRAQPEGVHGPSEVVEPGFDWPDTAWHGLPLRDYVFYELHVGTFTDAGTLDAAIDRLDDLAELGISAVELMPLAQFPGERNWGYDGVYPYAVQASYGGPAALKRFVAACHARGLAVVLDVVYNHLGPEGNYLRDYGPYFTDRYQTPWGAAINFDSAGSDGVRRFFIENALEWVTEYRIDALRLDAVHAMLDLSATHFLEELAAAVHERAERLNRRVHLIAESDLNAPRLVRPRALGGYGLDASWSDDFHHALHVLLTGERTGYYRGYGGIGQLAKAYRDGFIYTGEHAPHRSRRHGAPADDVAAERFVVCIQNHDQVGNRVTGDRLGALVSFEAQKLAAAAVLLSPFLPLLFMGEEYGEPAPFPYFVSHSDPELVAAVREGRKAEFEAFRWEAEPPDPQAEETFRSARLQWRLRSDGEHARLLALHRELLRLRREVPALRTLDKQRLAVEALENGGPVAVDPATAPAPDAEAAAGRVLLVRRWTGEDEAGLLLNFDGSATRPDRALALPAGRWRKLLDTADGRWAGPGSQLPETLESDGAVRLPLPPHAAVLLHRERPAAPVS